MKDNVKAAGWYQKAAEQGYALGERNLGNCYYWGKGRLRNYEEAMKWYRKAAEQGNADAQYRLGDCYYFALGVKGDLQEAVKWYQKAAELGHHYAKERLMEIKNPSSKKNSSPSPSPSGKKSSGCFITTAVCQMFHKPDDCYELTMFRHFRDTWLINQPDGKALIAEYYAVAPAIVNCINQTPYSSDIYQQIWQMYLKPCLKHLEQRENEACKDHYIDMVKTLKARYYDRATI